MLYLPVELLMDCLKSFWAPEDLGDLVGVFRLDTLNSSSEHGAFEFCSHKSISLLIVSIFCVSDSLLDFLMLIASMIEFWLLFVWWLSESELCETNSEFSNRISSFMFIKFEFGILINSWLSIL